MIDWPGVSMRIELRRAPRYKLIANAEVVELQSDRHFKARTSEVSLLGCYVNSVNWLPAGTEIRLRVTRDDSTFAALGTVVRSTPAMGMGVKFSVIELDQQALLKKWLTEAGARPSSSVFRLTS